MTPGARVQAAVDLIDRIAEGEPAEKALTNWARGARYAGSGDRAAVRDHVYDVLRRWRSCAALGGGDGGRARMLGLLRGRGEDPAEYFTGQGHAPQPLSEAEQAAGHTPEGTEALDLPEWLWPRFADSLGGSAGPVAEALRHRAEIFLRVNLLKGDIKAARDSLAGDGIGAEPHPLSATALRVTTGARRVSGSAAYADGLVELQDAASQAVVNHLPLQPDMRVLDYCAGGGGKALAMAARLGGPVDAYDADAARMRDLPERAARAGAAIRVLAGVGGGYDLVLCDAPCSGSGAWRRAPEGKWRLTPARLDALCAMQADILDAASQLVRDGGALAYATCSVLAAENTGQSAAFLSRNPGWTLENQDIFLPDRGGDGFYLAVFRR